MAQEEERRIQRDPHDGLGPALASIRVRLEACLDLSAETSGAWYTISGRPSSISAG